MTQWLRMGARSLPPAGKDAGLYLIPRGTGQAWTCDFGHVYTRDGIPYWESAFGIASTLDGLKIRDLLRRYEIWYTGLPPLLNGRVPAGFTRPKQKRKGERTCWK